MIALDAAHRRPTSIGRNRASGHLDTAPAPRATIARPAATIAVDDVVVHASTPNTTMPIGAPRSSRRACAVSTRSISSGRSSSSLIQATSAPLDSAQPSPQRHCETTSSGNPVTTPVMAMPTPITTCATTSVPRRLTASARTPAGTSATITVRPWKTPRRRSSAGERSAATTRWSAVQSHQPRASAARARAHRRNAVTRSDRNGPPPLGYEREGERRRQRPAMWSCVPCRDSAPAQRSHVHPRGVGERRHPNDGDRPRGRA